MDETTNPATEVDEALPTEEVDQDQSEEGTDGTETAEAQVEDDSEEVDYEGAKYRVPKPLKDALMRNADYTRKTQEVAEQRKALEQEQTSFQKSRELQQQNLQGYAQLMAIDGQLKQYASLDFQSLSNQDPVKAQQLHFQYTQLRDMRQNVADSLRQSEAQAVEMQRAMLAKRINEAKAVVAREIPDWSEEKSRRLYEHAISRGAPPEVAAQIVDPWLITALNDAYEFRQLQAKAKTPPPKPVAVAKPVSQLPTGKTTVQKDPSEMTDKEFAQWRQRQIAQRRK